MFTKEVKRVQNMLAELLNPSAVIEEGCPGKMIFFNSKKDSSFTLYYSQQNKCTEVSSCYVSDEFNPDDGLNRIVLQVDLWYKKQAPTEMDSIEADVTAMYSPKPNVFMGVDFGKQVQDKTVQDKIRIIKKHLSIIPDVKFIEDMYLDDMEKTATFIVKESRVLIRRLFTLLRSKEG